MNAAEMIVSISEKLRDPDISAARVLPAINQAIRDFALLAPLPGLQDKADFSVGAGDEFASLPSNYHHDVWWARSQTTGQDIVIRPNRLALEREYWGRSTFTGPISHTAVEGQLLWFRPLPASDEVVSINYYQHPPDLTASADTPSCVPELFHESYLVNLATANLYDLIEDGIDGNKPNTNFYLARCNAELPKIKRLFPNPIRQRPKVRRRAHYF